MADLLYFGVVYILFLIVAPDPVYISGTEPFNDIYIMTLVP